MMILHEHKAAGWAAVVLWGNESVTLLWSYLVLFKIHQCFFFIDEAEVTKTERMI